MSKSKPRVIKDYAKLTPEIQEQIKLVYPKGFSQHLIGFSTQNGERYLGLPFETEDHYYLVRMSREKARKIVENDDDFDEDGTLRDDIKEEYENKYDDADYLGELNNNEDNDFESNNDDDY